MDIDESGRDHLAVGVDGALRVVIDVTDRRDASVLDATGHAGRGCRFAIDDRAIADDQIRACSKLLSTADG